MVPLVQQVQCIDHLDCIFATDSSVWQEPEGCLGRIVMANSFAVILPVAAIIVASERLQPSTINGTYLQTLNTMALNVQYKYNLYIVS
jgi:hypothetical protein